MTAGVLLSPSHKEIVTQRILFDFAQAVGMSDARTFIKKMNLTMGTEALAAGPIHMAYAGKCAIIFLTKF
jgi:ADP-heptose:LPS heptosyltransferase